MATLETIEEDGLVANAEARGQQLRDGIMACGNPLFVSVRGRGLLDAVELAHPCAHAAMNWALEHGFDRQRGGAGCASSCSSAGGDRTGY